METRHHPMPRHHLDAWRVELFAWFQHADVCERDNREVRRQLASSLGGAGLKLLRDAAEAMRLSARGYHRVLKVARTIADLDGAEAIARPHLAEALAYRALYDRLQAAA